MARIKVMKLWTAIVTAFLALFAALGLAGTTASAAVQQTETTRNSNSESDTGRSTAQPAARTASPWSGTLARALPPTMKQRIHAEAHGKSPSCRHHPDASEAATSSCAPGTASEEPLAHEIPLQR
ncbi:DUF6344 domain-containing protein [Streptomyces sp. NPDC051207]|uniref:DUF6344 domain-containing protein n=1 Tax=Streptomyces sp. NPDC051207 TaxID=3154641 RepID=UPI00342FEC0F